MCTHVSDTHPHFVLFCMRDNMKSLLALVCRSWTAVFVPAVLVNSFSTLTQVGQQQKKATHV